MPFRLTLKFCLVSIVALVLSVPALLAQQPTGATMRGLVADPDDAVIPGATVTLTAASGKVMTGTSGSDGTYTIRNVSAGVYSLTVTMKGFSSYVKQGVRVT